jgi:hypothetical protein
MSVSRCGAVLLLLVLGTGCATSRAVHLDTGQGKPLVYTPPGGVKPIRIDEAGFRDAMTELALSMRLSLRGEAARSRFQRASWTLGEAAPPRWQGDDPRGCAHEGAHTDCLTLLDEGMSLKTAEARRQLALSFAWDTVWDGARDAVQEVINPATLKMMITSAMAAYMLLLVAPEPVTKLVAIALTTYLVAYLGLDVVFDIVAGWKQLAADSEQATSVDELKDTGHRFGKVIGKDGARVLIMALTAALGGGSSNLASKGPMLPGFARATLAAETNAGLQLSRAVAGGVRSISLAEGTLTVGVATDAVASLVWKKGGGSTQSGGSSQPPARGPGRWEPANESMKEPARRYEKQVTGAPAGQIYKVEDVKFDGFKEGVLLEAKGPRYAKFIPDAVENGRWFTGFRGMVKQAQRQQAVAGGYPIQWHFAERSVADFVRSLFARNGLADDVSVIFTPPQ